MTDKQILIRLIEALQRKDTNREGTWGFKTFHQELNDLLNELTDDGE